MSEQTNQTAAIKAKRRPSGIYALVGPDGKLVGEAWSCRRRKTFAMSLPGIYWRANGAMSTQGGSTHKELPLLRDVVAEANRILGTHDADAANQECNRVPPRPGALESAAGIGTLRSPGYDAGGTRTKLKAQAAPSRLLPQGYLL